MSYLKIKNNILNYYFVVNHLSIQNIYLILEDLERLPDTEQSAYRTETAANATLPSTGKMLEEIKRYDY